VGPTGDKMQKVWLFEKLPGHPEHIFYNHYTLHPIPTQKTCQYRVCEMTKDNPLINHIIFKDWGDSYFGWKWKECQKFLQNVKPQITLDLL